jgi:cytidylate kinase
MEKAMTRPEAPVITVDGPSGAGKGTLCEALATRLGWHFLDSGALYRVLALDGQQAGVALDDAETLAARARSLALRFAPGGAVWLGDQDVSLAIRTDAAGQAASQVAALLPVREALLVRQRDFAQAPGLVADGRDMGTVVFPEAPLKIYLSASAPARAERRYKQLKEKGLDANLRALLDSIQARDERDQARSASPLRPADDALVIDSTALAIDDVFGAVWRAALQRGLCAEG